ncbi:SDR family oxidoreductase [Cryobacterium sandaracinum]|uniref:SDR family oxidoreductase n=1 Tax=Cryobacterium sandaracinum TaxID=1259247 RepID=A0ABY2JI18_9MICO|nr:SDR family oxidoreductase [Cryobacterium sandaracinum]
MPPASADDSPAHRSHLTAVSRAPSTGNIHRFSIGSHALTNQNDNPRTKYITGGNPKQEQSQPGLTEATKPRPDRGEDTYHGAGKLVGRRALITGGDSGIGRAVAIAYAKDGADIAISYLPDEQTDAEFTAEQIRAAGRTVLLIPGDIREETHCVNLVKDTVATLGGLDILVLNAAYQKNRNGPENLSTAEFDRVFKTNLYATLWIARTAIPHLWPGASIISTSSIPASSPAQVLIDYAMTKAALVAFTRALAQELGPAGVRVNAVAPGPVWTPLIPAASRPDKLSTLGRETPLGQAGQTAELAAAYVFLASPEASYISGSVVPITRGRSF